MKDLPSRISFAELEYDDDGLYVYRDIPYTGIVYREEIGVLRYEQPYKDGLPWGNGFVWSHRGNLRISQSYYRGALHGVKTEYDEDGEVVLEEVYEFGILLLRKRRNDFGDMVEEFKLSQNDPGFETLMAFREMYSDEILTDEAIPSDLRRGSNQNS